MNPHPELSSGGQLQPVTEAEVAAERNPTRKAILSAMATVLAGTGDDPAMRGRVSIAAVAAVANIKVHHLKTGTHRDLKDRFLALKAAQEQIHTPGEFAAMQRNEALAEQLATITRRYQQATAERDQLRRAMDALAHQLQATILEKLEIERRYRDAAAQGADAKVYAIRPPMPLSDPVQL